ncbi:hypothetical protein DSM112329_05339 [Paraconexibacter sp. AEG42_29]|uniref:Glycoside hydrolase family 5 domain-containing protein n=1 Tax=Paraconexibacter sp. AEG42_29 TaxID=2997339 RepID=A0AAU7B475_9ACTN
MKRLAAAVIAVLALAPALLPPSAAAAPAPVRAGEVSATPVPGKRPGGVVVRGNQLVDTATGKPVRLLGMNRGALGDACTFGGISDGPLHEASIDAMVRWHITAVRLPINQDCWLGTHGLPAPGSGTAAEYRDRVVSFVQALEAKGLFVILDNQFGSVPVDGTASRYIAPLPDATVLPFLTSLAQTFAADDDVIFDVYNEPHPDSADVTIPSGVRPEVCWRDGCTLTWTGGPGPVTYPAVGMQAMVDAVRSTGARQPIMIGGLGYASDLRRWLEFRPTDPEGQIVASLHFYQCVPGTSLGAEGREHCRGDATPADAVKARLAAWDATLAPLAKAVPVVAGEIGEYDCDHDFSDQFFDWADTHGVSYLGWTWNATDTNPVSPVGFGGDGTDDGYWFCDGRHDLGHGGPALISRYDGTPTPFGEGLRARLVRYAIAGPDPLIDIAVPVEGQRVTLGAAVPSAVACRPEVTGSRVVTCSAPPLLDTSQAGPATFTVTALDAAGHGATRTVNYVVDTPPPPPPPTVTVPTPSAPVLPVVSLTGVPRSVTVSAAGVASLRLRCLGTVACSGTASLTATTSATAKQGSAKPKPRSTIAAGPRAATKPSAAAVKKPKRTTVASTAYSLKAGRSSTVKLKVNAAGRKLLAAATAGRLEATLTVTPRVKAARPRTKAVTLKATKPKA